MHGASASQTFSVFFAAHSVLLRPFPLVRFRPLPTSFMWNLRYRERRRFSTRQIVLPFIYDRYLQHRIRFYVVRTETCRALLRRARRHLLCSAIMVCLMGHTAVQTYVAEGFLAVDATTHDSVSLV